jgi:hypothetical protein
METASENIETQVRELVRKHLTRHGVDLGAGAGQDFESAIKTAVEDIEQGKKTVADADLNFGRFIDQMVAAAKTIPGYQAEFIGEQTYAAAMSKLCPLWPFC